MLNYSEKYAKKQRKAREVIIEKAKDLINHPKKYDKITSAGSAAYINNIAFDKTTGEVVEGKAFSLNLGKIQGGSLPPNRLKCSLKSLITPVDHI